RMRIEVVRASDAIFGESPCWAPAEHREWICRFDFAPGSLTRLASPSHDPHMLTCDALHSTRRLHARRARNSLNVFPSLKGGDFRLLEADVPARDEEIDRRVDVPVMPSTTSATAPLSDYEALSTLWAAACTARGTDLRGKSLVNLDVLGPMPCGFVVELGSKLRPAGIEYGLGQAGPGQSAGIDIADADAPILAHESLGQLVQEMLAAVRDLRMDGPHTQLASGALCDTERPLVLAIEARRLDLLARRERDQGFEAEVDPDLTGPMLPVFGDLDLQIQGPAAPGILAKAAAEHPPVHRTAEPKSVSLTEENHGIALQSNGARRLEGNPPQGLSSPPSRPLAAGVPGDRKLLADRLHGIRVQAEELAAAAGEIDQIEARGPALVVPASGVVDLPAIVPDPVHRPSLSLKMPAARRVLDPVPVRKHHGDRVMGTLEINNSDAEFSCEFV